MSVHEDYKEMLAAHGLGALDTEDARALDAHLRDCAECRGELKEWQATAAALALDVAPFAPSAQVRDRIVEAARTTTVKMQPSQRVIDDLVTPQREPPNVVSLPTRRRASAIPSWFAVAAGLVFVVLLGSLFVLWRQNQEARQETARLSTQVADAQRLIVRQKEALEILTAQGSRISELAGTKEMPGAHGLVAIDKNGRAALIAKGLPTPPAGKAYQLWFIAGGRPLPGRVFVTDESGAGSLTDQVPTEAMNGAVFAVTLEPESGVSAPTGAIYLSSPS